MIRWLRRRGLVQVNWDTWDWQVAFLRERSPEGLAGHFDAEHCSGRSRWLVVAAYRCWRAARGIEPGLVPTCRVCGCTDLHGCDIGCWWVEDDLCSACTTEKEAA